MILSVSKRLAVSLVIFILQGISHFRPNFFLNSPIILEEKKRKK
jgi:hypothetical protein